MYNSGDIRQMKHEFKEMVEDKFNKRMNYRYTIYLTNNKNILQNTIILSRIMSVLPLIDYNMYFDFTVILQLKETLEGSCILGGMLKLLSRRQLVRDQLSLMPKELEEKLLQLINLGCLCITGQHKLCHRLVTYISDN